MSMNIHSLIILQFVSLITAFLPLHNFTVLYVNTINLQEKHSTVVISYCDCSLKSSPLDTYFTESSIEE